MKPLITLLLATCLLSTTAEAQSRFGMHVGGMPIVSMGTGFNYQYSFGRNNVGIAAGIGAYGISTSFVAVSSEEQLENEDPYDGSEIDLFYNARIFYNRILSKRSKLLYAGGGVHGMLITNEPWSNLTAIMPELHGGLNFNIGSRIKANVELAVAVGPVTGEQERITDFGREIEHGTQLALYIPITANIYWLRKR